MSLIENARIHYKLLFRIVRQPSKHQHPEDSAVGEVAAGWCQRPLIDLTNKTLVDSVFHDPCSLLSLHMSGIATTTTSSILSCSPSFLFHFIYAATAGNQEADAHFVTIDAQALQVSLQSRQVTTALITLQASEAEVNGHTVHFQSFDGTSLLQHGLQLAHGGHPPENWQKVNHELLRRFIQFPRECFVGPIIPRSAIKAKPLVSTMFGHSPDTELLHNLAKAALGHVAGAQNDKPLQMNIYIAAIADIVKRIHSKDQHIIDALLELPGLLLSRSNLATLALYSSLRARVLHFIECCEKDEWNAKAGKMQEQMVAAVMDPHSNVPVQNRYSTQACDILAEFIQLSSVPV
jgi:hypothetical protein